jgi:drug/metabolite transporter (DMT)-like permease
MAARQDARVWLALVTVYIVWGSTFIALAIAVRDLPPFLAMAMRHLVAGGALLVFALPRGDREGDRIGWAQVRAGIVFGGLLFLLGHGGLAWAQQTVPAGVAALLVGSIPIWMALLDRIAFGRRLRGTAYVGFALGFVGLAFLVDPFGEGSVDRLGAVVVILAALCWAAGSLYSRGAPLPRRPLVSAGLGSLCGGVLLIVASVVSGEVAEARFTPEALLAVAYLVVVGSFVGFTAYVWLLRVAPTSLVATYAYVNPIVAVFLGWVLLDEEITLQMAAAGAAVVVAVALILHASRTVVEPGRGVLRRRPRPLSRLRGREKLDDLLPEALVVGGSPHGCPLEVVEQARPDVVHDRNLARRPVLRWSFVPDELGGLLVDRLGQCDAEGRDAGEEPAGKADGAVLEGEGVRLPHERLE